MSYSAQQCLDRATICTLMVTHAKDRDAKATFIELARQWQGLAQQKEDIERNPPKLS